MNISPEGDEGRTVGGDGLADVVLRR